MRRRNIQPWYHSGTLLVTATTPLSHAGLEKILRVALKKHRNSPIVDLTIETLDEPEPGDPAALL
jgi:hypothetical protein